MPACKGIRQLGDGSRSPSAGIRDEADLPCSQLTWHLSTPQKSNKRTADSLLYEAPQDTQYTCTRSPATQKADTVTFASA